MSTKNNTNNYSKILAKDTEIGKTYMSLVMKYEITVIRKEEDRVIVTSKLQPTQEIIINNNTELLTLDGTEVVKGETDINVINKVEEVVEDTVETDQIKIDSKSQTKGDVKSMAQNKNPRSTVIDTELLKYKKGDEVPWSKIADKVIAAGTGVEDDRKNIINQARVRFKWYTEEGKVNPQSPEGKKAKAEKVNAKGTKTSTNKKATSKAKPKGKKE